MKILFLAAGSALLVGAAYAATCALPCATPHLMRGKPTHLQGTATASVTATSAARAQGSARGTGSNVTEPDTTLEDYGLMPELSGATTWLNSPPLTRAKLKGKVVLIDFWTYSCVNCLRALPYVKMWDAKYRDQGLVVIGIHAPEFDFERDSSHVAGSLKKLGITYPVAMDNDMKIWNAFHNQYWPAHYFVDVNGHIRHHHFGEGQYDESERVIQKLLADVPASQKRANASSSASSPTASHVVGTGEEAAADFSQVHSPETYIGAWRAERFVSPEAMRENETRTFTAPKQLSLNDWALTGRWTVDRQYAELAQAGGSITFRFHARDLHLVLGPSTSGQPVSFRVLIDGKAPGANAGTDINADGVGTVTGYRLYQLIRQTGAIEDRTFTITFQTPGVRAFAFTFG